MPFYEYRCERCSHEIVLMFRERHQCPCSIGDIRGRNGYRVGKPLRVHGKMSLIPDTCLPAS